MKQLHLASSRPLVLLALALTLLVALDADARPGGGQGYSGGGSSHSGGGGGGGDGAGIIFELLIRLIIYYPQVGIPLTLIVIIIFVVRARHGAAVRKDSFTSSGAHDFTAPTPRRRPAGAQGRHDRDRRAASRAARTSCAGPSLLAPSCRPADRRGQGPRRRLPRVLRRHERIVPARGVLLGEEDRKSVV